MQLKIVGTQESGQTNVIVSSAHTSTNVVVMKETMKMRLIDADELLKIVDKEREYLIARGQTGAEHILVHNFRDLIDNAPTVSLQDIYQEGHYDGHLEGYTKAINEERPQGDLISREALKKAISELPNDNPSYYYTGDFLDREKVLDEIDNAPTVEYTFEEAFQKTICEQRLYCPERPQGEWIPCYVNFTDGSKPLFAYCKCSLCNKQATGYYKFCPNCGAEMKPKTCTNCETFGQNCGDCEVGADDQ